MVDKFYPTAPEAKPEAVVIDEAKEGPEIIAKIEEMGLNKIQVVSAQLAGRDCIHEMNALYDKVIKERNALKSVSIAEASTQTEYVAKLTEKAVYADPAKWLAGVKLEAEVTMWTALKEAVAPKELEAVEISK